MMSDIPHNLPLGLEAYGRSIDFTADNLPLKLQRAHTTRPGTWGLIHVLEGRLHFELEAPLSGEVFAERDDTIVIKPQAPHHVRFVEPGRFYVEFYRLAGTTF
jgi:hemoglobin